MAEELVLGTENITTGASSDFEQATKLATNMVMRFGMSDAVSGWGRLAGGHKVWDSLIPRPHLQLHASERCGLLTGLSQHVWNSRQQIKSLVHFKLFSA